MDGFQTLEEIRRLQIKTSVFVVSGDVQEEARRRVFALGALEFITKPTSAEVITNILSRHAIRSDQSPSDPQPNNVTDRATTICDTSEVSFFDCYQEITNIAVGHAGDLLARLTGQFVKLPIPKVAMLEPSELLMALAYAKDDSVSAVCQGFIGQGIAGEALLLFSEASFASMAELMKLNSGQQSAQHGEVLADLSGILVGAVLFGLGEQLDVNFSQSYPMILGNHTKISTIINANANKLDKILTIEVNYSIENYDLVCDVLLLFTHDSIDSINSRLSYFYDIEQS